VADGVYDEILSLLERVPKPPEAGPPEGATRDQLDALERRIGFPVPASLRSWLSVCNGYIAGPGGLFGARPDDPFLDIAARFNGEVEFLRERRTKRWLPIAGDGCGNDYVLDVAASAGVAGAVYFVDSHDDPVRLAYAVGSSIPRFLTFLLEDELGEKRWPFDADYFLAHDPHATSIDPRYLPWNAL
jgi:hypothetical protein